jgi:hypothetical protein
MTTKEESDEFAFKKDVDMNGLIKQIGESLATTLGTDPSKMKCKGIRIYYVNEHEVLASSGRFVKNFSPEDWDD